LNYRNSFVKIYLRTTALLFLAGIFFSNAILQISTGLFLPFIVYVTIKKARENRLKAIEILIILLFLSGVLSIYVSPVPFLAFKNIIRHCILLTLIPLLYITDNDDIISIDIIGKCISIFALITASYGIVRYFDGAERAFGFFAGYYTLASVLAFGLPITFAYIFYSTSYWKHLTIISTIFQFTALWLTFTRSALLGIIIGSIIVIMFLLFQGNISKLARTKIIIASIAFVSVFIILLFTNADTRLNPIKIFSSHDISSGRFGIYTDAYNTIRTDFQSNWENILIGHGLNSRIILFPGSQFTSWESEYVESLMTQGLIGLLLVILIYIQFFKNLLTLLMRLKNSQNRIFSFGLAISGISFGIISFFSSQLLGQNSSAYFVVLYSLILLIDKVSKKYDMNTGIN